MVVQELWRELHQAKYEPAYFELQFDRDGQMPAIDIPASSMPAKLRGFVDRVDTWQQEGCTFVRVVDYKTGKKAFDYCDVFNGVGLQMLLYLFALEDAGGELISGNRVSAGVQYFPARAPYVRRWQRCLATMRQTRTPTHCPRGNGVMALVHPPMWLGSEEFGGYKFLNLRSRWFWTPQS